MKYIYIILSLLFCGCSEVCDVAKEFCPITPPPIILPTPTPAVSPTVVPTSVPTVVPSPTSIPTPLPPQNVNDTFLDGNEGNLWKPASDNTGLTVVLLHKKYKEEMDSCSIELKNGQRESLRCEKGSWNNYSCFANGDRQHWRSNKKCQDIKSTTTICKKGNFTLTVTGGNDPCKRQD